MNHFQQTRTDIDVNNDDIIWMWKSNNHPYDMKESEEWTPYSAAISTIIENAHNNGESEIHINENYTIDLCRMFQINTRDTNRQRPVKRCVPKKSGNENDWRSDRFGFQLETQTKHEKKANTSEDNVKYHGSKFIIDWLHGFTKGKYEIKFDAIFPVLIDGLRIEGQLAGASEEVVNDLIGELQKTRTEVKNMKEAQCMEKLMKCCARLYTRECFLFRLVNVSIRDDDRTKLNTIGPYCYLLFNYIGSSPRNVHSLRHRLRQLLWPIRTSSIFVYRGDRITKGKLEEYQKAVGLSNKYFQWLSFVSTSLERSIGEEFARNVLYVIELKEVSSSDQYVFMDDSEFDREKEILLPPGVRFRVKSINFDAAKQWNVVDIEVVPSYLSNTI